MLLARRILFVTKSFDIGGTETHLLELLPLLKAKGFDIAPSSAQALALLRGLVFVSRQRLELARQENDLSSRPSVSLEGRQHCSA